MVNKKPPLNQAQKKQLGEQICQHYRSQDKIKLPVPRVVSVEPEGSFAVLSYPHAYKPEIDRIIENFYNSTQPPKKRKRTPITTPTFVKEISVKPIIKQ